MAVSGTFHPSTPKRKEIKKNICGMVIHVAWTDVHDFQEVVFKRWRESHISSSLSISKHE